MMSSTNKLSVLTSIPYSQFVIFFSHTYERKSSVELLDFNVLNSPIFSSLVIVCDLETDSSDFTFPTDAFCN